MVYIAVIGVYDWDFMNYENVIPNLECAKLYTYFHNHHDVAVLAPACTPEKYTKFYIRKEYNDGVYPKSLFAPNAVYGGRAFNPVIYSPLAPEIERTIPNMHLYDKYKVRFGSRPGEKALINKILNCAHLRLSTDGINSISMNQLLRILDTGRFNGIIFHDYNLGTVNEAYNIIYELTQVRHFKTKEGINPYRIGNKFPIQVSSAQELEKWFRVGVLPNLFSLQYNGIMDEVTLNELCTQNKRMVSQIYYKIDASCSSENHFLEHDLLEILKQVIFLRRQKIRILLKYDDDRIITPELRDFLDLLNCWLCFHWHDNFLPMTQSLYTFCRKNKKLHYHNWSFMHIQLTVDQMRDSFQFLRERNYEIFTHLYDWDSMIFKGGKIVNEWTNSQTEN